MAIAKALLGAGAELSAQNDAKQTPADVAKLNGEVGAAGPGEGTADVVWWGRAGRAGPGRDTARVRACVREEWWRRTSHDVLEGRRSISAGAWGTRGREGGQAIGAHPNVWSP